MIVICSTHAAKSKCLNEKIRHFKLRRGADHVIPVIVDGEPHHLEQECFPPTLRHKLGADGVLTWEHEQLIAVDARPNGEGKKAAARRIVARLLGLDADEFARRCREARMRRIRRVAYFAIGLAALAFIPTNSGSRALRLLAQNDSFIAATLKASVEFVSASVAQAEKLNVPRGVTLAYLNKMEGLLDEIVVRPDHGTKELRYRKAWALIEFARAYDMLGHAEGQKSRAERARWFMRGRAEDGPYDLDRLNAVSMIYNAIGRVLATQGVLNEAIESYRHSLSVMQHVAASVPANVYKQRSLSLIYFRLGNVLLEKGAVNEALENYHQSLLLSGRIVSLEPLNPGWQRDLADISITIADVLSGRGEFPDALEHYWKGEVILERLASQDRAPRTWHVQLDYTRTRIANILQHEELPEEHLALWYYDERQGFRAIAPQSQTHRLQ